MISKFENRKDFIVNRIESFTPGMIPKEYLAAKMKGETVNINQNQLGKLSYRQRNLAIISQVEFDIKTIPDPALRSVLVVFEAPTPYGAKVSVESFYNDIDYDDLIMRDRVQSALDDVGYGRKENGPDPWTAYYADGEFYSSSEL